jgi:hypothetical protein
MTRRYLASSRVDPQKILANFSSELVLKDEFSSMDAVLERKHHRQLKLVAKQ